jgi:hypothetical protein
MKLSTRPFMVEIKNRKRATSPAMASSFNRREPPELSERNVHEDLTVAPAQTQALREAEKVFRASKAAFSLPLPKVSPQRRQSPLNLSPRVLPDLRAVAREEERDDVRKPRREGVSNRSTEGQPRKKAPAKPAQVPAAGPIIEAAPAMASEAAMALSHGMSGPRTKLPPGQRWRERRLPRVCWDRRT